MPNDQLLLGFFIAYNNAITHEVSFFTHLPVVAVSKSGLVSENYTEE